MLDFIFGIMLIFGFMFFMLALEKESYVVSMVSFLLWLFIWAQSMMITVPCDTNYSEWGLQALAFGFMMLSIVMSIFYLLSNYFNKQREIDEGNMKMKAELLSQRHKR